METKVTTSLPHDVVECILERLPVKALVRFKSVSPIWRYTIDSQHFKKKQFMRARLLEEPNILIVKPGDPPSVQESIFTMDFDSGSCEGQQIPLDANFYNITHSCDGLVCIYDLSSFMCVINPATRWQRSLPHEVILRSYHLDGPYVTGFPLLGFGKDNIRGIYKMVWLHKFFGENYTTCEIFSLTTNTRISYQAIPQYQILDSERPVYVDGSLYWFIRGNRERRTFVEILSFDLHTENFRVMPQTPVDQTPPTSIKMTSLDNQLCVSVKTWSGIDMWLCNTDLTWQKAYKIDRPFGPQFFGEQIWLKAPVAVLGKEEDNKKLLVYDWDREASGLMILDFQSGTSLSLSFGKGESLTAYLPSLLTI